MGGKEHRVEPNACDLRWTCSGASGLDVIPVRIKGGVLSRGQLELRGSGPVPGTLLAPVTMGLNTQQRLSLCLHIHSHRSLQLRFFIFMETARSTENPVFICGDYLGYEKAWGIGGGIRWPDVDRLLWKFDEDTKVNTLLFRKAPCDLL